MSMEKVYARAKEIPLDVVQQIHGEVPPPDECDCYECAETRYGPDGSVANNLKWHTLYQPCPVEGCDEYRTEYLDLGRKGYFTCPKIHSNR